MPFKGMLKWAVAKEDLPSKSKSSKSLRKRRKLSHHHHYCSILRSGVCLRLENASGLSASKKPAQLLPTGTSHVSTNDKPSITSSTEPGKSCSSSKLTSVVKNCAGATFTSNNSSGGNYSRGLHHHQRTTSSSRFRLKVARHWSAQGIMGNSVTTSVKTADKNNDHNNKCLSSENKRTQIQQQCITCPPGNLSNFTNNNSPAKKHEGVSQEINRNNLQSCLKMVGNGAPQNTTNSGGNADSKSLLYMSLDHLPLAIVRQYERMLQESTTMLTTQENDSPEGILKEEAKTDTKKSQKMISPKPKKIVAVQPSKSSKTKCVQSETIISAPFNDHKSIVPDNQLNQSGEHNKNQKSLKSSPSPVKNAHTSNIETKNSVSIKQARSRALQVHTNNTTDNNNSCNNKSSPKLRKSAAEPRKRKSPSPEPTNEKCTQTSAQKSKKTGRFKVTIVSSPALSASPTCAQNMSSGKIPVNNQKNKSGKVNDVEKKDVGCETESKHFPLKSILKDCKSSTLPRMKSDHLKQKGSTNTSGVATSDKKEKGTVIYGRSSSFRLSSSSNGEKSRKTRKSGTSPVSSRKESLSGEDKAKKLPSISSSSSSSSCTTPTKDLNVSSGLGHNVSIIPCNNNVTTSVLFDHDTTDPQFLEMPVPICTPAVSRCAKKLTLKRSEIRKLERIRTQTEKLNRFLKKYYHDCLPNLPEEEEETCSPEEKSVHLSVLRTHWVEKCPEESTTSTSTRDGSPDADKMEHLLTQKISRQQRRNTLPHTGISTSAFKAIEEASRILSLDDNLTSDENNKNHHNSTNLISQDNAITIRNTKNTSLLSSSAYYSDPILSSLPIIIEDPEILMHHQLKNIQNKKSPEKAVKHDKQDVTHNNQISDSLSLTNLCTTKEPRPCCGNIVPSCNSSCSCSCSGSTTSSIINLAHEFRMAEVNRQDNRIHESFLMSTHNFPLEDSSIVLFPEKEFLEGAPSSIVTTTGNNNTDKLLMEQESVQHAQEAPAIKNYHNNESGDLESIAADHIDRYAFMEQNVVINDAEKKRTRRRTKSDNNNNTEERSKNKGGKKNSLRIPCNIQDDNHNSESNSSINEETETVEHHHFGTEKLKGFGSSMMMMMLSADPLATNHPFDVPTCLAEDEGFMSPYPPEAYSPASTSSGASSASLLNRLSISSGKGSAEDYDDERRLELFLLDSSCETSIMPDQQITTCNQICGHAPPQLILHQISGEISKKEVSSRHLYQNQITEEENEKQEKIQSCPINMPFLSLMGPPKPPRTCFLENCNYLKNGENDAWNSHDYETIGSSSASTSSTSTDPACGSFFPNSHLLDKHHHHQRQASSDSSYIGFSLLNCENGHSHHLHHHHHNCVHNSPEEQHIYDEVANTVIDDDDNNCHNENQNYVDDDEQEESVIIQSSVGSSTGAAAGIAFSTPIRPNHYYRRLRLSAVKSNGPNNYSQCSTIIQPNSSSVCSVSGMSHLSSNKKRRYVTPRKVVRKPLVRTPFFNNKGELLVRCYRNGDYATVHVVQAKNLQVSYRSSWKLSMKISLIPEGEATFTKSESVVVPRARGYVRIDQKFSFEIPQRTKSPQNQCTTGDNCQGAADTTKSLSVQRKVFLTFLKRIDKRSTFLGWISLEVPEIEDTKQCWLKLRKRKMSSVSSSAHPSTATSNHLARNNQSQSAGGGYLPAGSTSPHLASGLSAAAAPPGSGGVAQTGGEAMVGLPSHIEALDQVVPSVASRTCKSPPVDYYQPQEYSNLIGKQLQNSSTMDSGVEDCCEPPPVPSIELDDKLGFRVRVHMTKPEGSGFGFSVVWVSPPRIERLEKDKTADVAGLKIGDLIIGVNGEDVTTVPNTTIYNKMKSTGMGLDLEVWRKHPHVSSPLPAHITSAANVPQPIDPTACVQPPGSSSLPAPPPKATVIAVTAETHRPAPPPQSAPHSNQNHTSTTLPQQNNSFNNNNNLKNVATSGLPNSRSTATTTTGGNNPLVNRIQPQPPPPTSILKPPPPAPPVNTVAGGNSSTACPSQSQPTTASSAWRIRFNIELLDNEDDNLKQFFICELKFFRKVVAALDRYLIPAQANRLLTPQEIHLIFAQVIKIITMTKRILQCVANGSASSTWKLGRILLSTHSDHLPDITSAYTAYARSLGYSAMILSEKMSIQDFAKFVLETPVPKGHLDMTSLLFAPFEHLRNLCEIGEEISHQHDNWIFLNSRLKECYAEIVCETDFMEPISHISMKKNPLLSVRDLEKRIISTTSQQPLKVCEKGRKWLFGSRLYRRENDGSWSPVWAFLFTDIIVLTSHMTRDRVFFVKETPIRLDDVVTLHFNLPKKHENEFRLLFGPDTSHHSRLDRILPLVRSKKPNQVVLRTANLQLKSLWKLLLQRQIISLNTRLSKSSSSNFSISEFCEKFPVVQHDSIMEEDEEKMEVEAASNATAAVANPVANKLFHSPKPSLKPAPTSNVQVTQNSNELHPSVLARQADKLQRGDQSTFPNRKLHAIQSTPPLNNSLMMTGNATSKASQQQMPESAQQNPAPPTSEVKPGDERTASKPLPQKSVTVINGAPPSTVTSVISKPYIPDGLSSINRELMRARVIRADRRPSIPGGGTITCPSAALENNDDKSGSEVLPETRKLGGDRLNGNVVGAAPANIAAVEKPAVKVDSKVISSAAAATKGVVISRPTKHDASTSMNVNFSDNLVPSVPSCAVPPVPKARTSLSGAHALNTPKHVSRTTTPAPADNTAPSPVPSHNNNNTIDNASLERKKGEEVCPCATKIDKVPLENGAVGGPVTRPDGQPTAYPSPKPRQLSNLKRYSKEESTQTLTKQQQTSVTKRVGNDASAKNANAITTTTTTTNSATMTVNNVTVEKERKMEINGAPNPPGKFIKDTPLERIPEALQSPVMVKRAQALASGADTPSSSSSLSPAHVPRKTKMGGSTINGSAVPSTSSKATENLNAALNSEILTNNVSIKSKPGSRIMTNAILKSRQQELIAQNLHSSVSTETLRTEKSSDTTTASTSKTNSSTQYFSLKEESTTTSSSCSVQSQTTTQLQPQQIMVRCVHNKNIIVHHQHHSHHCPGSCCGSGGAPVAGSSGAAPLSPHLSVPMPPRCHSENSHHPKKSKPVHTDSPIIGGFNSERARRRMLVDNKLRKDYPELFGISPKDRRSFIKQLGDLGEMSTKLVAPYYYTLSPVPIPKHRMMTMGNSSNSSDVGSSCHSWKQGNGSEISGNPKKKISPLVIPPFNPNNSHAKGPSKINESKGGVTTDTSTSTAEPAGATKGGMSASSVLCSKSLKGGVVQPAPPSITPRRFGGSMVGGASVSTGGSSGNSMSHNFREASEVADVSRERCQQGGAAVTSSVDPRRLEDDGGDDDDDDDDDEDNMSGIAAQLAHDVYQASFELDEDGQRLKDFVEKMRAEMSEGGVVDLEDDDDEEDEDDEEEEEEDDDDDSDDSTAGGHEGERGQSHRSHEESSNDSGISDEMTEKSKTTMSGLLEEDEDHEPSLTMSMSRRNENFSNMLDCMRSGVLAAEVKKNPSTNPDKISSTTTTTTATPPPVVSHNKGHVANIDHTNNKGALVGGDDAGKNVKNVVVVVDSHNKSCCSPNDNTDCHDHACSGAKLPSHVVCCTNSTSPSSKSHVVDDTTSLCFLEGETKASVEAVVVLKADKATETEDDDFNFLLQLNNHHNQATTTSVNHSLQHPPANGNKPLRSILAERREAFFLSQQNSFQNPHCPFTNGAGATTGHSIHFAEDFPTYARSHAHNCFASNNCKQGFSSAANNSGGVSGSVNIPSEHPLIVKIVEGGTLHSVVDTSSPNHEKNVNNNNNAECERVQLQRLERHKKAKVERVESEDSTSSSSDLASASPAAENGRPEDLTTDPSWSSSSSSLAGYASSKEEPLVIGGAGGTNGATCSSVATSTSTVAISASSSAATPVVAPSACSQCSNSNNNNNRNSNLNNKDSISSVSSSCTTSISVQTHDEPSTSCRDSTSSKSYSLLESDLSVAHQTAEDEDTRVGSGPPGSHGCSSRSTNYNSSAITCNNHDTYCTRTNANSKNNSSVAITTTSTVTLVSDVRREDLVESSCDLDSSTSGSSVSTTSNSKIPLLASKGPSSGGGSSFTSSSSSRVVVVVTSGAQLSSSESRGDAEQGCHPAGPEIVVTQESDPEESSSHSSNENINTRHGYSSDGEEDSIVCNGKAVDSVASDGGGSSGGEAGGSGCSSSNRSSKGFLRVESNDSTAENYGDDDDYNFDDDDEEDDLSHCSVATINRYGTFESLEKLESEDTVGGLPDFHRAMPRSKARFTFEDDDDDDDDLFEEDFETDFNFRFPSQIQDNTYSVSRLGPLPPLLEEDYEDDMYDDQRTTGGVSPSSSSAMGEYSGGMGGAGCSSSTASLRARHEAGLRRDNSFLLARLATMYARSSISPLISTMAVQRVGMSSLAEPPVTSSTATSPCSLDSSSSSSPLTSRSQKLVVIQSSDAEMLVVADTIATSSSTRNGGDGKGAGVLDNKKDGQVVVTPTNTSI